MFHTYPLFMSCFEYIYNVLLDYHSFGA